MQHSYLIAALVIVSAAYLQSASAQAAQEVPGTPQERFELADTDQDGAISRQEFADRRSARFGEFDTDESGKLSPDEFGVAIQGTPAQRFGRMAFRRADQDGDGHVSRSEWDGMPLRAFDRLDANKDGRIDGAEFER